MYVLRRQWGDIGVVARGWVGVVGNLFNFYYVSQGGKRPGGGAWEFFSRVFVVENGRVDGHFGAEGPMYVGDFFRNFSSTQF